MTDAKLKELNFKQLQTAYRFAKATHEMHVSREDMEACQRSRNELRQIKREFYRRGLKPVDNATE